MTTFREGCRFCDTNGDLQILPLRYAVIGADETKSVSMLPALSGTLGDGVTRIALGISNARYVVRPLRCGYLYVLIERKAKKTWQGYAVSKGGELYRFDPEDGEAPEIQPFVCDRGTHGIHASFVHIPDSKDVTRIWMLFTPDLVTKRMLDLLKQYETTDYSGIMQVFHPADWKKGNTQQQPTLKPEQIETTVAEMLAENVEPLRNAINHSLFPTYEEREANIPLDIESFRKHTSHLKNLQLRLQQLGGLAFVLHDAIGITQELNDFRNASLERLAIWQAQKKRKKDGFNSDGITNEYRVKVLNAIDNVRATLREAAKKAPVIQGMKQQKHNTYAEGCIRSDVAPFPIRVNPIVDKNDPKAMAELEKIVNEFDDLWWDQYCEGKGLEHKEWIDSKFLRDFRKEYTELHTLCDKTIKHRHVPHLNWLKSREILNALFVYDSAAPEGSQSGLQFAGQVGLASAGVYYTEQGRAWVDTWAKDFEICNENLLMRAFCYNQRDIQKAMTQGLTAAMAAPDLGDREAYRRFVREELYGITEDLLQNDDDGSAWMSRTLKIAGSIAKLADKTVKALGESANRDWVKKYPLLGMTIDIPGKTFNAALRFSITPGEEKIAKALLAMQEAPLGRAAFKSYFGVGITDKNVRQVLTMNLEWDIAKYLREEAIATHRKTLDIWKNDTTIRGDYMRIRTGGIVMAFEAINLLVQGKKAIDKGEPSLALLAASLACVGVGGEIYAYGYRTLSRTPPAKADIEILEKLVGPGHTDSLTTFMFDRQAGGYAYGRIKLWTGGLLGFAGAIGGGLDIYDASKAEDRGETWISRLLFLRGVTQFILAGTSFGTAWADTGVFF